MSDNRSNSLSTRDETGSRRRAIEDDGFDREQGTGSFTVVLSNGSEAKGSATGNHMGQDLG